MGFLCFKQNTAYEMRISDWSSDVCSSDLSVRDLAEAMQAQGVEVDRKQVQLDQPIKLLGLHKVRVVLHPEVTIAITANVARTEDEAQRQSRGEDVSAPVEDERDFEPGAGLDGFLGDVPDQARHPPRSSPAPTPAGGGR